MPKFGNLARMSTATTGTGTITLGSAVSGFLSFSAAGIADQDVVRYAIFDGANSEVGYGTYTASGTTLTRNVITSTNSNTPISLSGSAQVAITAIREDLPIQPFTPGGRLTLVTGLPVMTSSQTAKTTLFYTPYRGAYVPLWDGSSFVPTLFSELSQTTTDTTKSPAAMAAESVYDIFVWNDAGTLRATRGPAWAKAQTITSITNGTGQITLTAHGLTEGQPVSFSTTGTLPTGLTPGTIYYVTKAPAANTFFVSTTLANAVAGTAQITSSAGSGTHTITSRANNGARGTGAGTSELQLVQGIWTNKNAITNGPAAGFGTYVGTVRSNGSSQLDWNLGSAGSGGSAAALNIWNCYNRVPAYGSTQDNGTSYNYSSTTFRIARNSVNNLIGFIVGVQEDLCKASYCSFQGVPAAVNSVYVTGMNIDDSSTTRGAVNAQVGQTGYNPQASLTCYAQYFPSQGWHFVSCQERGDGTNSTTFTSSGGTNILTLDLPM